MENFKFKSKSETQFEREAREKRELQQRLMSLINKKVSGFEINDFGCVTIKFEDNTVLSFTSWNALDDEVDFPSVEIKSPEK